jgi:hypothetical protein|tara:strand:+ start:1569 stop:1808 length:240 start_codon:yes stop_codon:yes gene_type:complete
MRGKNMGSSWNSRQPARDKDALKRISKRYDRWKSRFSDSVSYRLGTTHKWNEAKVKKWFESLPRTIAAREKAFVKEMKE